jgi:hypothetical protein
MTFRSMSDTQNTTSDSDSQDGLWALLRTRMATLVHIDRMQRLGRTAVVVGVIPWVLAAMLHAGQLVLSDGGLGLRAALGEMFASPMSWLPVVAVMLYAAASRGASSVASDPVARALIVAGVVWVGVLGVLLLVGKTTFGADGLWFYVRLTAYLPLVAIAAAVRTT